jgi:5'-nucleotidase
VAAAKEAALSGVAAIAISIASHAPVDLGGAARFALQLVEKVYENQLPFGTFLNVNLPGIPFDRVAGVRISRQGFTTFVERMEKRLDPRNRPYYWQGVDRQRFSKSPDVDGTALENHYISITPIQCDMTDYRALDRLREWGWDPEGNTGRPFDADGTGPTGGTDDH